MSWSAPSAADESAILQGLLEQAHVFLAQGQPTKALNCVLAVVRYQRGEAGVFDVLNETREAHGLHRLEVPAIVAQIDGGGGSGASSSNRLQAGEHDGVRRRIHAAGGASSSSSMDAMDTSEEVKSSHSAGIDVAEQITTLFQRLGVDQRQQQQQQQLSAPSFGSSHSSASPFYSAASSSSSSSRSHPHPHRSGPSSSSSSERFSDSALASMIADTRSPDGAPLPSVHYPSMRTVLPAMPVGAGGGGGYSSATLEEIHSPWPQQTFAAASASSSSAPHAGSGAAAAAAAVENATPLLALAGREDVLDLAYDSHDSVICPQCSALVPAKRFAAHRQWWCQVEE